MILILSLAGCSTSEYGWVVKIADVEVSPEEYVSAQMQAYVEARNLAEYSENMEYAIKRLQDYWNKNEWIILTFVNHDQVEEVSLGIIKLEQLCNEESYQLYRAECVAIKESLSHLIKCDRLSLQLFI